MLKQTQSEQVDGNNSWNLRKSAGEFTGAVTTPYGFVLVAGWDDYGYKAGIVLRMVFNGRMYRTREWRRKNYTLRGITVIAGRWAKEVAEGGNQ